MYRVTRTCRVQRGIGLIKNNNDKNALSKTTIVPNLRGDTIAAVQCAYETAIGIRKPCGTFHYRDTVFFPMLRVLPIVLIRYVSRYYRHPIPRANR